MLLNLTLPMEQIDQRDEEESQSAVEIGDVESQSNRPKEPELRRI